MTLYDLKRGCEISSIDSPLSMALGCFDGVHLGHAELIRSVKETGRPSAVFTFSHNPFGVLHIADPREKLRLLHSMNIDYCILCDFEEVRDMPWQSFAEDILIKQLNVVNAVCGFNFRFGLNAEGTPEALCAFMEQRGRNCTVINAFEQGGCAVSSSRIRSLLSEGKLEEAARLLGRNYSLVYNVSHGNGIGNTFGFPTINTEYSDIMLPIAMGVYICRCLDRPAVTNFGVRPTLTSDKRPVYETYILDYDGNLYGKSIRVEFFKMLRPEIKFDSAEMLIAQIGRDVKATRDYFNNR